VLPEYQQSALVEVQFDQFLDDLDWTQCGASLN